MRKRTSIFFANQESHHKYDLQVLSGVETLAIRREKLIAIKIARAGSCHAREINVCVFAEARNRLAVP